MKRVLLAGLAVICIGLGVSVAQNVNKAIQLSQDATGSFGVDSNNNVYFPAHILNNGPGNPAVAAAGGTAPTINAGATDNQGIVTGGGASTTTVTITFKAAYLATPACVVSSQNPGTSPLAYNPVATGINITTGIGAAIVHYVCMGAK